jgi:hypothetical protein
MTTLFLATAALAGHAGAADNPGTPVVLPFELWLGVMAIALLLLIAIAWLVGNALRLQKLDRRLRALEERQKQ